MILVLLLAALTFNTTAHRAADPIAVSEFLQGTPRKIAVGAARDVNAACRLGITGKPAWVVDHLAPPDDAYYTLLDPKTCGCSGPEGVRLPNAHVMLEFPAACGIPASVAVVKADLTDELCPVPVPDAYLFEPITCKLSVKEAGPCDLILPLDTEICITQKAFLVVAFPEEGDCKELPRLLTTDGCSACASYGISKDGPQDLCRVLPGNPIMCVEATCCDEVPARRTTWGEVKTHYR